MAIKDEHLKMTVTVAGEDLLGFVSAADKLNVAMA